MMKQTKTTTAPTAARRRSTNTVLVLLAVAAAIGTVLLVNYVVYWQYRSLSPDSRQWVRYDLTATRRYSLSDQTRSVIADLEDEYRLVSMLGGEDDDSQRAGRIRDLIDEYARSSQQITVQHIDLGSDSRDRDALLNEMDAMFAEDTKPIRASITDGLEKVDRYANAIDTITSRLGKIIDSGVELRPASIQRQRLTDLHSQYLRLQDERQRIHELRDRVLGADWRGRLQSPGLVETDEADAGQQMPDYTTLMAAIQRYVIQLTRQTLPDTPAKADALRRGVVVDRLARPELQEPALEAQNTLAALVQQVPELQRQIVVETDPLLAVVQPRRYDEARAVLNDKPCVLLTSGGKARVLPADLLFRGASASEEGQANDLFVGEEQLTGAFISVKLAPPPLVVFVRSNTGHRALSLIGTDEQRIEGLYDHVANRLLTMDFELAEWADPLKDDPPQPLAGQRVVWVTLPYLKPDISRKESLDNTRKNKVAAHLDERLEAGDSALVMLSFNPDTNPELGKGVQADALAALLSRLGIQSELYHTATRLSEENEDPAKSRYSPEFLVESWPDSPVVGRSLDGIDTYFFTPMPLNFTDTQGVEHLPLVELTHPAMYVQKDVPDRETGAFTPEPDSGRQRVMIGAAAKRGQARLATVGDATWALDSLTSLAVLPSGKTGPDLAEQPGARLAYPGNTDLFVNTICWLAHEEQLIAASPRVQDVRRIGAMSAGTLSTYRITLWGGMPAVIFIVGIVVWLMRRRA